MRPFAYSLVLNLIACLGLGLWAASVTFDINAGPTGVLVALWFGWPVLVLSSVLHAHFYKGAAK